MNFLVVHPDKEKVLRLGLVVSFSGLYDMDALLALQPGERALLAHLLARLQDLDPDVLVGHNIAAFDLDVLLHRLQHHKARAAPKQGTCCDRVVHAYASARPAASTLYQFGRQSNA